MATLFAAGGPDRVAGLAHGGGEPSAHWAARGAAGAALASAMRSASLVLCTALQRLPARHGPACDCDFGRERIRATRFCCRVRRNANGHIDLVLSEPPDVAVNLGAVIVLQQ